MQSRKAKAVQGWPEPRNVSEVKSILGWTGYYRQFIPEFSTIASPLTKLTRKNRKFCWDESCQKAFDGLKQCFISAPLLSYPNSTDPFILYTDASLVGIGGALSQVQNGEEKVIAYAIKTLSKTQQNYCVTHRELLAVVEMWKQFKHFLLGRHFLLRTDHAFLVWLKILKVQRACSLDGYL